MLRGLPSIALRYAAQDQAARELAVWMQAQAGVSRCCIPRCRTLQATSIGSATRGAASLFSVVFDDAIAPERVVAFCDALRLFRLGYSWAGPVSLCVPYERARCAVATGSMPMVRCFAVGPRRSRTRAPTWSGRCACSGA